MFTGLVERTGRVVELTRIVTAAATATATIKNKASSPKPSISQLTIDRRDQTFETSLGDSIAINGCCLTVTSIDQNFLQFDVSSESLARTSLSFLQPQDLVNLERAMAVGDRLGGHMVSGHIDTLGTALKVEQRNDGWLVKIQVPSSFRRYVINKGSICIDGVSLTINRVNDTQSDNSTQLSTQLDPLCSVDLMIIPKTIESTTFSALSQGQRVNVEVDLIGKYVERLTTPFS